MLKKIWILGVIHLLLFSLLSIPIVNAEEVNLTPNARSAILIDQDTGTILYEKNSHDRLPPASITKIMTMLLIMEALDQGKIALDDKVRVSENAASMGGSQIFLEVGEEMTVKDLLKGIAIASGNDASVAMAEYIAGSEEGFVHMMNKKVEELGLKNTHFVNSNGLPENDHYTSAYDIAIMSRELLKYEKITEFTGIYEDYLRKDTDNPFWLVNTNRLVRFYEGADGLKTGYTSEAKYCLSATAKRGSLRVIAVVMGEPNTKTRNKEISQLLDFAFSQYKNEVIYQKNQMITKVEVSKGKEHEVQLVAPHQISILMKKGEKIEDYEQIIKIKEQIQAPIKQGDILGALEIIRNGKIVQSISLESSTDISKANLYHLIKKVVKEHLFLNQ
ncbi:D-alanyl-D-alanine carboxypeptidase family protein [Tepidibacillus infernus]|uniref:serine-type D-Ala-D-Ala carboxypeptidase n=1 Tax=Tepidibacillus decaturensis TaxID=1413211 RepID=A0A135L2Y7_9BACI|nr:MULTISPECIES: D-alanyl-D-alanine carboxypeptidase family protein [Tepidibacillus]KXG43345.1 D-alanyl-D-alanine carboxypeptidase [Tepidibacillus decaturensis]GBF11557.1 D-alanyl-D-alanine carboxypeptidase DacF precursor [Tepidibacillus sp. HK-1]